MVKEYFTAKEVQRVVGCGAQFIPALTKKFNKRSEPIFVPSQKGSQGETSLYSYLDLITIAYLFECRKFGLTREWVKVFQAVLRVISKRQEDLFDEVLERVEEARKGSPEPIGKALITEITGVSLKSKKRGLLQAQMTLTSIGNPLSTDYLGANPDVELTSLPEFFISVHLGQEGNLDQVMIINYSFPNKEILDFRVMVTINGEGQFVTENQADIDGFLLSSISRFEINMNKLLQKVRKGLMEIL